MKKHERTGFEKGFIDCSSNIQDIHENIEEYNSEKKFIVSIVLVHMIADIISNKKT